MKNNEVLYEHVAHPHEPMNVNVLHRKMQDSFNDRVAIFITQIFSAMPTFWLITTWIVLWILGNATIAHFDPMPWPLLLCLASVPQLPLMIVILVGQAQLGKKAELQSEEQYRTTKRSYHDITQIMYHLDKQDGELLKQTHLLLQQGEQILRQEEAQAQLEQRFDGLLLNTNYLLNQLTKKSSRSKDRNKTQPLTEDAPSNH